MSENQNQPHDTLPERRLAGTPAQTMKELDEMWIAENIQEMADLREDMGFDRAWLEKPWVTEALKMGIVADIALCKWRIEQIRRENEGLRHGKRPV